MPKKFSEETKQRVVEAARTGARIDDLARESGASGQSIRNWIRQAEADVGLRPDALTSIERAELARLRKENKRLREEAEILGKAQAWFASSGAEAP